MKKVWNSAFFGSRTNGKLRFDLRVISTLVILLVLPVTIATFGMQQILPSNADVVPYAFSLTGVQDILVEPDISSQPTFTADVIFNATNSKISGVDMELNVRGENGVAPFEIISFIPKTTHFADIPLLNTVTNGVLHYVNVNLNQQDFDSGNIDLGTITFRVKNYGKGTVIHESVPQVTAIDKNQALDVNYKDLGTITISASGSAPSAPLITGQ